MYVVFCVNIYCAASPTLKGPHVPLEPEEFEFPELLTETERAELYPSSTLTGSYGNTLIVIFSGGHCYGRGWGWVTIDKIFVFRRTTPIM